MKQLPPYGEWTLVFTLSRTCTVLHTVGAPVLTAPQWSHCTGYGVILQPQGQCFSPCWEIGLFQHIPELSSLPMSTGGQTGWAVPSEVPGATYGDEKNANKPGIKSQSSQGRGRASKAGENKK